MTDEKMESTPTARPLTGDELDSVCGGVLPILAAAGSLAMNLSATNLTVALGSRALAVYSVYEAAKWAGGYYGSEYTIKVQ